MKTLCVLILVLVGCSGPAFTAGIDESAGGGSPPSSIAGEPNQAGSEQGGLAGSAGAPISPPVGGQAGVENPGSQAGGPAAGGAAPMGGRGGSSGALTMAGAPSMAGAPGCQQTNHATACEGRTCGYVPDGCGGRWACGTPVCAMQSGVQASCVTDDATNTTSCQVTCSDIGRECGDYPQWGLHCGGCTDSPNGQCGVELPGVCSYCKDAGTTAFCSMGEHTWRGCGQVPRFGCHAPASNDVTPGDWCCPAA